MSPIRIIGTGSPFGQDQLGLLIIDALESGNFQQHFPTALISLHRSDRPGAALLELFNEATSIILIDALAVTDADEAFVRWLDARELMLEPALFSSHSFGISEALQLGRVLGELPRRLRILGIGVTELQGHCQVSLSLYKDIEACLIEEINLTCQEEGIALPEDRVDR